MILDNDINLSGIDQDFLDDLDEFIEDYRVELFITHPNTQEELDKAQKLAKESNRFKYSLPIALNKSIDENCVALRVASKEDLEAIDSDLPLIIHSQELEPEFISSLIDSDKQGIILDARESDQVLEKFILSISKDSLEFWSKKGLTDIDLKRLTVASKYPKYGYDELIAMIKEISDFTLRAEQTIIANGTRACLKMFGLM